MNKEEKRIVKNTEDLIFFTNTDEKNYPVYITSNREVWLKAKPHRVEEVKDKWGYVSPKRIYDIPISATFFVKNVAETSESINHPLLEKAVAIIKEVTKSDVEIQRLLIKYEVYKGDMERLLGEADVYTVKVASVETPFSGSKYAEKKAWAIGYDWRKRIVAKAPELESYTYVKGAEGRRGRAYVKVITKLPVPTEEFTRLFNLALSSIATQVSVTSEIEQQVKQIEELIKQKENELQALREQLQQLQLKLQLEQMKRQVV